MNKYLNDKKFGAILLIIVAIVGSFVNFYGWNLAMSDLSNMFYGVHDANIIATVPMFMFILDFVLLEIYIFRFYYRPQYRKSMTLVYLIIGASFSLIGFVFSILTGTMIYPSFFSGQPFKAYSFIFLVLHLILLALSVLAFVFLKLRWGKDYTKRDLKVHYVLYSIFLSILTFYAFNRFGTLMYMPVYCHWRTLYLTWPFYLSLLLPMLELVHTILYMFDWYKNNAKIGLIFSIVLLSLDVVLYLAIVLIGINNPVFISAISPALPIERLAAMPVDTILSFLLLMGLAIYAFNHSLKLYKKQKNTAISE